MKDNPLVAQIKYLEDDYKTEIEKWKGIKEKLLKEIGEAQSKIEEAEEGLNVLRQQKRKLGIE